MHTKAIAGPVGGELKKQPLRMPGGRLVKAASGSHFSDMQHLLQILLRVVRSLGKLLKPDGVKALVEWARRRGRIGHNRLRAGLVGTSQNGSKEKISIT